MVQELKLKRDEKQKLDNDIQDQNELVCTQPINKIPIPSITNNTTPKLDSTLSIANNTTLN